MVELLNELACLIGNTPLFRLRSDKVDLFAKLEYFNLSGSIKDRSAYGILLAAAESGQINKDTKIIESSSGNMAMALATICGYLGLEFIPVIDANINPSSERVLRNLCKRVEKITSRDETGAYLLNRINRVKEICAQEENMFWTNQYQNENNYLSYYNSLGIELSNDFPRIDYVFIAVSSGGTITGISKRMKERHPNVKVVAVDIEGSVIFSSRLKERLISGIGAGKIPRMMENASIDEILIVSEEDAIEGRDRLNTDQAIFAGLSSGAIYFAILKYFTENKEIEGRPTVVFCCPDRGTGYLDSTAIVMSNKEDRRILCSI